MTVVVVVVMLSFTNAYDGSLDLFIAIHKSGAFEEDIQIERLAER